ncbi:PPPDE putative peptidase domain-containing protein [Phlyctochytrium arcticum]|nr:PPPDE putative peptidase domain-containing protein [Phlyctochytrium arcticum]
MSARVQLYVYDLSQGMARMLSQNLVGRQIDGIWHTSVVVFGQEYFFGQGIMQSPPGQTHHGVPLQVIPMGETQIPKDIFLDYLNGMKEHWTADKYHLLDNNCNTFSNELCNFLVGKDIPSHITGLPAEFLNTPLGQSLRPMLENMFGPSQLAQGATAASRATGFTGANISPALAGMVGSVAASAQSTPPGATQLQTAQNLRQFNSILSARRAVIVDFTSQTCPPCRVISPEFERLVREHNEQFHQDGMGSGSRSDQSKIVGVKVEVGMAPDISQKYQISATPTFVFFLDGKEFSRFSGANSSELKSNLNFLIYSAYPPHSHSKLRLPTLDSLLGAPVLFTQSTNIDAIFKKLSEFMDQQQELESLKGTTESLRVAMKADKPLSLPNHWDTAIHTLLEKLPIEQQFPLLDIIRLLILDDSARRIFIGQEKGVITCSKSCI